MKLPLLDPRAFTLPHPDTQNPNLQNLDGKLNLADNSLCKCKNVRVLNVQERHEAGNEGELDKGEGASNFEDL